MKDNQTEAKLERIDTKLRNLTFIVILGFVVIALLVIGLYFKDGKSSNNGTTNNGSQTTTVKYDVSKMKKVTGEEAAKLFDEKGTIINIIDIDNRGQIYK